MTRSTLPSGLKDGFTISPGWAAIFVTLFLAAAAAGATGLSTASATETKVENNIVRLNRIEDKQDRQGQDVAYIRARIDGFMRHAGTNGN